VKLVDAIRTKLAFATGTPDPFDTSTIPNLPFVVHVISYGNDNACTFVACDSLRLWLHGQAK
jgi:hypothetical protein